MKSKQKASKQKIKALKYYSCHDFMALWYEKALPRKKSIVWKKAHGQFCIFIPFVELYGMTGRKH